MNYYFAADVHLGLPVGDAQAREQLFIHWLDHVKTNAAAVFLLGDIFDFWCEYKTVVPRGFVRTFGKLAELTDSGIPVHFFPGNHDLWVNNYLSGEIGLIIHRSPLEVVLNHRYFYLSHGDVIEKRPKKLIRWMFGNRFFQKCFAAIHPRWGVSVAWKWSLHNRLSKGLSLPFKGDEEPLVQFAKQYRATHPINHYIFGHLHTPVQWPIAEDSQLTILGEWIKNAEYAVFDGKTVSLKNYFVKNK